MRLQLEPRRRDGYHWFCLGYGKKVLDQLIHLASTPTHVFLTDESLLVLIMEWSQMAVDMNSVVAIRNASFQSMDEHQHMTVFAVDHHAEVQPFVAGSCKDDRMKELATWIDCHGNDEQFLQKRAFVMGSILGGSV